MGKGRRRRVHRGTHAMACDRGAHPNACKRPPPGTEGCGGHGSVALQIGRSSPAFVAGTGFTQSKPATARCGSTVETTDRDQGLIIWKTIFNLAEREILTHVPPCEKSFLFSNDRAKFSDFFIFARNGFICKASQQKTCKKKQRPAIWKTIKK